jgi:hypothetical protein
MKDPDLSQHDSRSTDLREQPCGVDTIAMHINSQVCYDLKEGKYSIPISHFAEHNITFHNIKS